LTSISPPSIGSLLGVDELIGSQYEV